MLNEDVQTWPANGQRRKSCEDGSAFAKADAKVKKLNTHFQIRVLWPECPSKNLCQINCNFNIKVSSLQCVNEPNWMHVKHIWLCCSTLDSNYAKHHLESIDSWIQGMKPTRWFLRSSGYQNWYHHWYQHLQRHSMASTSSWVKNTEMKMVDGMCCSSSTQGRDTVLDKNCTFNMQLNFCCISVSQYH